LNIVTAKLKARATADGLVEFQDSVPLGKTYEVDTDSIKEVQLYNVIKGVEHTKMVIKEHPSGCWLPLEVLELPSA